MKKIIAAVAIAAAAIALSGCNPTGKAEEIITGDPALTAVTVELPSGAIAECVLYMPTSSISIYPDGSQMECFKDEQ